MAEAAVLDTAPDTIDASINYLHEESAQPFTYTGGPGSTEVRSGGTLDAHKVTIRNGRSKNFVLEENGFRFVRHDTRMANFFDADEISRVYYPEMVELIKAESGAKRVVVFDHTLRTADDAFREEHKIREPVQRAHNDYTEWSGPQRVRDLMGAEAPDLLRHRFAIIQVWRPIRHPVETFPLAICDAKTLTPQDLMMSERRYPNRVGQTYAITYNPAHRWYWFPHMRRDDALVFKVYDSLVDGRARWTAHSAFNDPTAPPNARPRESIEIRTLAFF